MGNIDLRSENSEALSRTVRGTNAAWYAVHTHPRHEKRVYQRLLWLGVDSYLPLYKSMKRWNNRRTMQLELPLFPGYLFAKIALRDRVRVLEFSNALGIVGGGSELWAVPETEIERLRLGLHLRRPEPHPYLTAGQMVRIKSGPLTGLSGILVRKTGGLRVVLTVDILMQSASVEVGSDDITPGSVCD